MMKAKVKLYDTCKYEWGSKKVAEVNYEIEGFKVLTGNDLDSSEYEQILDNDMQDEYDEYLQLYFENGDTATFRNSHADLFTAVY